MAAAYTREVPGHAESVWIWSIPAARARPANALARGSSAPAWPLRWHLAGFYRPWASGLGPSPAPGHRASGLSPRFHPDECSLTAALFRVLEGSVPHPHPGRKQEGILADIHGQELDPGQGPGSLHHMDGSTGTPLRVGRSPGSVPSPAAGVVRLSLC